MLNKYKIPLFVLCVLILDLLIYLWADLTVDAEFVFEKSARNSGRASAALNLIILALVGYFGVKNIYSGPKKRELFKVLISLFAVNHLVHFFFIFQNFQSQSKVLGIKNNEHGIITFVFVLIFPFILWSFRKLNKVLYFGILIHIFNTTYFMIDTFANRIKPDNPAYLHQIGIGIMLSFLLYILYRVFREKSTPIIHPDESVLITK